MTAATGVCHELGWNKSCIDVQGRLRTAQPTLNIYTNGNEWKYFNTVKPA